MSLREEIQDYILNHRGFSVASELTDGIISKIEKRIDSLPQRFEYKEIEFAMGFAEACLKIKEMLK